MSDYSRRIHRLLRIMTLVQGDPSFTPLRLAKLIGVHERSIFRDIEDLKIAGAPIDFDPEIGGYFTCHDHFLHPTDLKLDEAVALCLHAEQVRGTDQLPHTLAAERAMEKIRSNLPVRFRDELERVMPHINVALARTETEGTVMCSRRFATLSASDAR
jgi:predicted DNA-binding transcriptional regulator YafY